MSGSLAPNVGRRAAAGWARHSGRTFFACLTVACTSPANPSAIDAPRVEHQESLDREPLTPLPEPPKVDPKVVDLGRRLFAETRLSSDNGVACSSCHDLAKSGVDGNSRSRGVAGRTGVINVLTVYNASLNFALFWDGRAKSLETQIDGPITNPIELNSSWNDVVTKLRGDPTYVTSFARAFADGVTAENVRVAISAFERTLLTPNAPFDRWLRGDAAAMSADQREGYDTFKSVGCISCHQGANVGGNMFQRFGVLGDYFKDRGGVSEPDYGRFNATKNEADRFVFRVPSLRNVEYTAPYFHDGSAQTLQQAIQVMATYQLGRSLSERQVMVIDAFLKSLSGPTARASDRGGLR
jgi:cytochrome c peroxidase